MKHDFTDIPFEDSLNDDWSRDLNMVEVPLGARPFVALGIVIAALGLIVFGRVAYLNWFNGSYYAARAADNADRQEATPAPRGIIYDAEGDALVENKAVFDAELDARAFLAADPATQSSTLAEIQQVLGIAPGDVLSLLSDSEKEDFSTPVVLAENISQGELVNLQALDPSAITVRSDFERSYPQGPVFSSVVGYVGRVSQSDLKTRADLSASDFIGKMGIEEQYDTALQGVSGVDVKFTDARGKVLGEKVQSPPTIGSSIRLTIDGGLQTAIYNDLANQLASLGRPVGIGLAMDPRTGAVLSMVNLPGFNNNAFSNPADNTPLIKNYLTSSDKPLFNRVVSGQYQPGSTIKPLDGVAILKDNIISPGKQLYSPGYLMVPNPYDPTAPTKYLDWEPHGYIGLAQALAESSDVYFYITVGGSPQYTTPPLNDAVDYGVSGLGPDEIHQWWETFGLGKRTGIDLPGEAAGFLPTPAWWNSISTRRWSLGDTYNVSIGQGSLAVTPVQLLSYIDAIANGGTIYRPFLNASTTPSVNGDLTSLAPQIGEVQKGMLAAVTSPRGTAHTLNDLPAQACAKTGSAQVQNNQQENALFVGYFPCKDPQIALLILIENSREGSLNAVPVAKQVFDWYYNNRMGSAK